jgi:hypothetical protein
VGRRTVIIARLTGTSPVVLAARWRRVLAFLFFGCASENELRCRYDVVARTSALYKNAEPVFDRAAHLEYFSR